VRLLLDTHAFLWLNNDNPKLSQKIRDFCLSGEHSFYLSIASAWEIQIKVQLGKLSLAVPIEELVTKNQQENNIELLPIGLAHVSQLEKLPPYHKDPFDRIIIAQAIIEDLVIVSIDGAFADYAVPVIW
jgi:PIN domain nuclease of toxin-antitoxin system